MGCSTEHSPGISHVTILVPPLPYLKKTETTRKGRCVHFQPHNGKQEAREQAETTHLLISLAVYRNAAPSGADKDVKPSPLLPSHFRVRLGLYTGRVKLRLKPQYSQSLDGHTQGTVCHRVRKCKTVHSRVAGAGAIHCLLEDLA